MKLKPTEILTQKRLEIKTKRIRTHLMWNQQVNGPLTFGCVRRAPPNLCKTVSTYFWDRIPALNFRDFHFARSCSEEPLSSNARVYWIRVRCAGTDARSGILKASSFRLIPPKSVIAPRGCITIATCAAPINEPHAATRRLYDFRDGQDW